MAGVSTIASPRAWAIATVVLACVAMIVTAIGGNMALFAVDTFCLGVGVGILAWRPRAERRRS